jgi:tetratricopeptide (TPR) repeat protein
MLWKKHRTLSWACACALLAYLPISNFMALPSLVVGPYRTAVAGVPLAVLFGGLFQLALNTSKIPTLTVGTAYLGLSAVATFWGIGTWQSETVWFANLGTYDRRSYIAELNKTTSDLINKRNDLAMAESDAYLNWIFGSSSWRISVMAGKAPQYTSEMLDRLETNVGTRDDVGPVLGRLLTLRGRIFLLMNSHQEAIPTLQAALSCYPKYAEPAAALGDIYAATDPARANRYYEQAVNLEPSIGNIYRLAKMRLDQHRFYEAESLFQAALRQNENIGDLWAGLASAQCSLGEQTECQESFKSATDRQILDKTTVSLVSKQIERFRYR